MDKIYMDAKDKNVAKVVIYVDINKAGAFLDVNCTVSATESDLYDAFIKGGIIHVDDGDNTGDFLIIGANLSSSGGYVYGITSSNDIVKAPNTVGN